MLKASWNSSFHLLFIYVIFLCAVDQVYSGVTSSFVRSEWPAVDIPIDSEQFAVPKDQNAPQQVHITQGDYDGKAVIVSWVTIMDQGTSEVLYGKSQNKYDHSAQGKTTNYTYYDYKSGYIHHCLLDGLEYDTKYYYKVGTGDSAREFWFQTPPKIDPDAPYTFGIIGDLGQTYNSLSTLEHYMQSGGQTVLFVGDLSYADRYICNNGTRWDSWGRFIERSVAYQPWIWTAGNHEIEYRPDLGEVFTFKSFLHRFATPYEASRSSSPLWYAVRRASAHIIVLSSYSPFVVYTPQWHWLQDELKRVDREKTPWLIVLMHAPLYNSNEAHYMEGESMRAVFVTIRLCFYLQGNPLNNLKPINTFPKGLKKNIWPDLSPAQESELFPISEEKNELKKSSMPPIIDVVLSTRNRLILIAVSIPRSFVKESDVFYKSSHLFFFS